MLYLDRNNRQNIFSFCSKKFLILYLVLRAEDLLVSPHPSLWFTVGNASVASIPSKFCLITLYFVELEVATERTATLLQDEVVSATPDGSGIFKKQSIHR